MSTASDPPITRESIMAEAFCRGRFTPRPISAMPPTSVVACCLRFGHDGEHRSTSVQYAWKDTSEGAYQSEEGPAASILRDMVQWFREHDGRADDFGRLRFVAWAEDWPDERGIPHRTDFGDGR